MPHPLKLLVLIAGVALLGAACEENKSSAKPEDPRPFTETKAKENLFKLEFPNPLKGDPINPSGQNYAAAIRLWMSEHPDKKIVAILGLPTFSTSAGLQGAWLITKNNPTGELQRVVQLDLPAELPEEFTIATLLFYNNAPSGILGITP